MASVFPDRLSREWTPPLRDDAGSVVRRKATDRNFVIYVTRTHSAESFKAIRLEKCNQSKVLGNNDADHASPASLQPAAYFCPALMLAVSALTPVKNRKVISIYNVTELLHLSDRSTVFG
jgi:hypothetical protein